MVENDYKLVWENHSAQVFSGLKRLRTAEHCSDVTLHCGGQNFLAHKIVLASSSEFFERIFTSIDNEKSKVLVMTDSDPEMLRILLDFIYRGDAVVKVELFEELIGLARRLGIRGLQTEVGTVDGPEPVDVSTGRKRPRPASPVPATTSVGDQGQDVKRKPGPVDDDPDLVATWTSQDDVSRA
jgi:hypothetical protein